MGALTWRAALSWEDGVITQTKAVTIAPLDVTVTAPTSVTTQLKAITLTPFDAVVDIGGVSVIAQLKAISITPFNAVVDAPFAGVNVAAQTKAITVTPFDALVSGPVDVLAQLKAVSIVPFDSVVNVGGQNYVAGGLLADIQSDLAEIVRCEDELGSIVSINGTDTTVMVRSDSRAAVFEDYEVQSYDTRFYAVTSDLTTAGALIGTTVYYNNADYTIDKLEGDRDTGLTLVYIKRA